MSNLTNILYLIGSICFLAGSIANFVRFHIRADCLHDARAFQPKAPDRLAFITQTTLSVDDTAAIVGILAELY